MHVLAGNYQGFYLDTSGAPGNPITFLADGPGVAITADNPTTPDGINIEGADHVVIDGFTVTNRTRAGIRAALSNFVTIRNCTAGDNGRWGIFTGFTDDLSGREQRDLRLRPRARHLCLQLLRPPDRPRQP